MYIAYITPVGNFDVAVSYGICMYNNTYNNYYYYYYPYYFIFIQRCSELLELSESLQLMQDVLPLDSSCEDLEVHVCNMIRYMNKYKYYITGIEDEGLQT